MEAYKGNSESSWEMRGLPLHGFCSLKSRHLDTIVFTYPLISFVCALALFLLSHCNMMRAFTTAAYSLLKNKHEKANTSYKQIKTLKPDSCESSEGCGMADMESNQDETGETDEVLDESQNTSVCEAAWNLINMIEGTGLLGLPYAVLKGGYATVVGIILVAIISNYTGHVVISCLYDVSSGSRLRVRNTYEDIGTACWPRFGGKIVICLQLVELMSVSTLYLVLCGSLLTSAFPDVHVTEREWIAIGAVVVLPSVFLRTLSHVAWLSFTSTVAMLATVVSVIVYGALHSTEWMFETIPSWDTETVPVAMGVVIFSYAAHPLLPGLESSMEDRAQFPLMMNMSFLFATLVKIVFSLCAYLTFTTTTKEVVTNNLPLGVTHTLVSLLLVLNVLFSYAFPMFTVIQSIEDSLFSDCCTSKVHRIFSSVSLRVFLVSLTLFSALLIPHFALLMAFIGSLTGAFLVFIFPCLFQMHLQGREMRFYHIFINCFLILVGAFLGVLGMVFSGKALAKAYGISG